ncbi:radical SAM protein [Ruminococcus sp. 5_1_39BFAA]|uniref:radical SAM protein n=1 Tax=Ruminococcus sp. 5_1_39BFAA TaxID=457412 RepID=UPI00356B3D20
MTGLVCCTLDCNLACTYCYEGNGNITTYPHIQLINEKFEGARERIIRFIDELYNYNHEGFTKIIWHGGEPTLIKPELLDSIMSDQIQKEHVNIQWSIQSNGTLITEKYIEVLKKHNVSIGISLDGPKKQHDTYRVFKNGKPTFDIIMKNIDRLMASGVRCGTLITITDNNVDYLMDIYKLFAEKKLNFSFNALFPDRNNTDAKLNTNEYAKRICDLFDYWITDTEHQIMISPFMHIIEGLLKPIRGIPACHWSQDCSKGFAAIDTNGDLYPCEHWVGNHEYCFGNIDAGLEHELNNCVYFSERKDVLEKLDCKECDIWHLCYGGCPWNGWVLFKDSNRKDVSICQGRKIIINHIKEYLKQHDKL